ncbi:hypothetical protein CSAL01_03236 [Colletotrichum salicis]|uniref:DUF7779 domain-containing protein n=1 Tax=Colletotrichum salicis TaxID=1209931 RepID=A0A135UYV3_9PEZI|nr:hypothetical protein CSAL01_03236 [Colletotrichum salicis]
MELSELEAHFDRHWASTSTSGADRMEPNDRRTIRSFRNLDDVNGNVLEELDDKPPDSAVQDLDMLQPRLMDLKGFSYFFSTSLGPKLDPKAFWGLIGLVIVLPHEEALKRIAQMLSKLGYSCGDFQLHAHQSFDLSKGEKEACFEIFVLMTRSFSDAVRFLREAGDIANLSYGRGYAQESWVELTATYDRVQADIDERLKRIEKMAKFGKIHAAQLSFLSRSPRSFVDSAKLPCFVLPPATTNRFFNRDEVIQEIDDQFDEQKEEGLRSLALYGMGGVGKSHVALKYTEKKKAEKGLGAIFWIRAETLFSFQESFTDRWLQETECKWLLVYDNVEDFGLLRANWPAPGSQGLALITTRNHSLAFDPANGGLEVLPWGTANGTKFLLHLLAGHVSADLLASEAKSAYSLAERLSGHALAISNMSGLIHRQSWTISELLDRYGSSLNFKDGLEAVWGVSFKNLKPGSATLLAAFSHCAPDSIPHSLFDLKEAVDLPDSLLCIMVADNLPGRFDNAMEELLDLALVKRDRKSGTYSIHRLIQTHFLRYMTPENRQKSFIEASHLMENVFPKRLDGKIATMYNMWEQCQLWVQHVLQLKNCFRLEKRRDPGFYACTKTCAMWAQCGRFLLEQQTFPELEDLVEVGKLALATLPEQDPELYNLTSPETYITQIWARRGRYRLAIEVMVSARNVKLTAPQEDHQNSSWMANNISCFYSCLGEYETALEWQEISRVYGQGRTLAYMKKCDEARGHIDESLEDMMTSKPVTWGTAGECQFARARLAMFEGDFKLAELLFQKAQKIWLMGNSSRTSDFYAATIYRMGCCALLEGEVERAVKYLQDAMAITTLRKDVQAGEHVRSLYKLSEALYQILGRELEADRLLKEAEELYWKRVEEAKAVSEEDHGEYEVPQMHPQEQDYDSLVYMLWR